MKTPREILLERHRAVAPKLDSIRREIGGQASRLSPFQKMVKESETGTTPALQLLWRELIWPCRRIWAGLAAIWILIFIFNFSQRDQTDLMAKKSSPSPEMLLAFRQQEKLLAELIEPNEPPRAQPPKSFFPRPSSEGYIEILTT